MIFRYIIILLALVPFKGITQSLTSSNLPIVIITTDKDPVTGVPREIPDEPKILGSMKIIFHEDGTRNWLTDQAEDQYLNYDGRIKIEIRGSSSQVLPKKAYGFTTLKNDDDSNNNVELLGMPKENDWVLNGLAFDSSMVRDILSYDLARAMGQYAPRGQYCEVIINNDYKGVYLLLEKIKVDEGRVNILKMDEEDVNYPNVTGGYITKADKTTGGDPVAWSMGSSTGNAIDFIHESPKPEDIRSQQNDYIKNQFLTLHATSNTHNASPEDGYPAIIDVPSFIDFMLINELTANVDGYTFSTFYHKDRLGKLRAGPVWDFNLTFGNDLFFWSLDRSHTNVWQFDNGDNTGPFFWKNLYDDPAFHCYLSQSWQSLTSPGGALNADVIQAHIDSLAAVIAEAQVREQARWHTVGTWLDQQAAMKSWLQARIDWMDERLADTGPCLDHQLPNLVISRIHYHPEDAGDVDGDDLEFIAITNQDTQPADLTGIYFLNLGVNYVFPAGATLAPGEIIYLASNSDAFTTYYGFQPFGEFSRNLSNKSFDLVLADAFGNQIDEVHYYDSDPWPEEADGDGPYLQLIDPSADNNRAENWEASSGHVSAITEVAEEAGITLYPNPANNSLMILSPAIPIRTVQVLDLTGRTLLLQELPGTSEVPLSLEGIPGGVYWVKIKTESDHLIMKKLVKF